MGYELRGCQHRGGTHHPPLLIYRHRSKCLLTY
nr:MAG TPA: hypothetical protein [Caudoviricetes sp.]